MKIAILGAESTGKTQLAKELAAALQHDGSSAVWIAEALRDWCAREGRTPMPHEQWNIAQEQAHRVDAAANADFVLSDTTPLMTAIYSDLLFADPSLYAFGIAFQRGFDITLVTGLDIAWEADGVQRDDPETRSTVDTRLRSVLESNSIAYAIVYGQGRARTQAALRALGQDETRPVAATEGTSSPPLPWRWTCEKCSDPHCEHRIFSALLSAASL